MNRAFHWNVLDTWYRVKVCGNHEFNPAGPANDSWAPRPRATQGPPGPQEGPLWVKTDPFGGRGGLLGSPRTWYWTNGCIFSSFSLRVLARVPPKWGQITFLLLNPHNIMEKGERVHSAQPAHRSFWVVYQMWVLFCQKPVFTCRQVRIHWAGRTKLPFQCNSLRRSVPAGLAGPN